MRDLGLDAGGGTATATLPSVAEIDAWTTLTLPSVEEVAALTRRLGRLGP